MRREEIIAVMGIVKTAYSRFYQNQTKEETKQAVDLWAEMFKDDETMDVVKAIKELIVELEYPPTIADVKKKVKMYEWDREYTRRKEEENKKEQEDYERFLKKQEELKRLPKPEINKEEIQKRLEELRHALFGGKKDD